MVVPVRTDGAFWFGQPTMVFESGVYERAVGYLNYDIHPDGERFVMIQKSPSKDIVLVQNWFQELQAALGN